MAWYEVAVTTIFYLDVETDTEEEAKELAKKELRAELGSWSMPLHDIIDVEVWDEDTI